MDSLPVSVFHISNLLIPLLKATLILDDFELLESSTRLN
jgi:hypothetical protein